MGREDWILRGKALEGHVFEERLHTMRTNGKGSTAQRTQREVGVLSGKLVRYRSMDSGQWEGFSLREVSKPMEKVRSTVYWRDFLGGKRTLDPSYPQHHESTGKRIVHNTSGVVSTGLIEPLLRGEGPTRRTKTVVMNGHVRNDHLTSRDNTLNGNAVGSEGKAMRRRSSDASIHTFASQITNLPGSQYRVEVSPTPVLRPRTDSISKITTLPGPKVTIPEPNPTNPMTPFIRCTNTTQQIETLMGEFSVKTGPKLSLVPTCSVTLPSYNSVGSEAQLPTRKAKFIRKAQVQSESESDCFPSHRGRGQIHHPSTLKFH